MFRCGSPGSSRPWRGFPIRTPWDHSPVIDSPRLIADSYVLLRLLMPRHPPCALKNLTTKDQKTNFRENHENQPHPTTPPPKGRHHHAQPDPGSYSWKLLLIKDARVHYVVLKQQPRTTHPTHAPRKGKQPCDRRSQETRNKQTRKVTLPVLLPQDPTVCQTLNHLPQPRTVPQHTQERIRTKHRKRTCGRYSLIFHP